ncbi:organic solvent tolerance protein [Paramagnetospirillum marisnigri]|uniref:LPS-assembly protein LptD n=1 Tax=Paramagnetospirillum marisnigri TaxID=1285242 RepID=A0A178MTR9_9PROT|nr:LPS assembly protein LptD [Paramagnetospirillum marisnigri]OAN53168.1 organic solvent tolerance protein [Paramagnetospirillum marisnigri]
MSRSSPLSLFALLVASTALAGAARADVSDGGVAYPEVGGWGQAWGEDDMPVRSAPPVRPRPAAPIPSYVAPSYVPPPPAAALPSLPLAPSPVPVVSRPAPPLTDEMGQAYPEVGGWGQAWGEETSAPAAVRPRSAAQSPGQPVAAPAPRPSAPAAETAPAPGAVAPRLRATVTPGGGLPAQAEETAAQARRRGVSVSMEPADISPDAVGLRRPSRIIPSPKAKLERDQEGSAPPVHMEADQVLYDRVFEVVTAKGRVEMVQSGRTITADTVSYNLKKDLMGASGNVVLTEPTGEITQADYFELTGDFKNGVAENLRLIMADNSRLTAVSAQRYGGDRTDFERVSYTACEPCRDDPGRTPLWQAKALRVTHNQAEAQVEYRDAWVEMLGIPVLYTPYLSHPDPTVKRKSGFLAPTMGYNSTLGTSFTTPYFFVMSDHEDFTLVPRFMMPDSKSVKVTKSDPDDLATATLQHVHLLGEHRWRGVRGEAKSVGSITADKDDGKIRGHVESKGLYELDRTWRAGWQAQYQSDEVYRNLYRIRTENDRPWLLTRPYVEGFGRRNYAMAEAMSFQGHRVVTDNSKSPVVLPHFMHQAISEPGWANSYWTFDSDVLSYTRSRGTVAQRISHRTGWTLPMTSPDGQVVSLTTSMRGDGYRSEHLQNYSGEVTAGRAVPEVSMNWRYPFARQGTVMSQVIEPVAMVAMSPRGGNDDKIPNEDSLAFELDETNVVRPNRLVGLDRVEGGLRGGYGLKWSGYPARGGRLGVQAAQGWRRNADATFGPTSGFTDTFSDFLGRVDVAPTGTLALNSRFRLDKNSLQLRRNESTVSVGPPALSLAATYGYLSSVSSTAGDIYPRRQYLSYSASSALSQYWKATASMSQDLTKDGGTLSWTANTTYNDECFAIVAAMSRYYTDAPGLLSGYNATLTFVLKTLGEAPLGLF